MASLVAADAKQETAGGVSEGSIPVYSSLRPVHGHDAEELAAADARYEGLALEFLQAYGAPPVLFVRSPGRVNLIGEHIDYEGYSVLPMAIRQDTIVAVRKRPDDGSAPSLRIANVNSKKYPAVVFPADPSQEVDRGNHSWANYFVCGYKGVWEHLERLKASGKEDVEVPTPASLDVMVDGIVPTGAGLSSSAAIVCASAGAVMAAHGLNFSQTDMAELCCKCERHIGTQSGGMDQAISIMAKPGVALLIDFNPVRATDVALPEGGTFVIANSLTESNKAETAAVNYNMRVVECRLAAMVLGLRLGLPKQEVYAINTLGEIEDMLSAAAPGLGGEGPLPAVEAHLKPEPYVAEELEELLGEKLETIMKSSPTSLAVLAAAKHFALYKRAKHVFSEKERVYAFRDTAARAQSSSGASFSSDQVLEDLGQLMNESHASCSELYECSCKELEELVGVCRKNGAIGSRLTGAGWGGCTVSLVRDGHVAGFIESLKEDFYKSRVERGLIKEGDLESVVFASKPAGGAAIFRFDH
ncbi:Galactokinase [Klebsormidium nitens]|uniref:Galactokinase n=1 Tax=Klebsormidium nitens TaxID=105231 RepID=A0A1Y1HLZ9_KLENI|nr:Galactokinase [Klebsormidium nitens]|eukprot:GAQ79665.1 Galactokinase [Klebsormidium nitens]